MDADNAVAPARNNQPTTPPPGFEQFYRAHYRRLKVLAMHAGARRHEADDVASSTLQQLLPRWEEVDEPFAWARRALVNNLIKVRAEESRRAARQHRHFVATYVPPAADPADLVYDRHALDQLLGVLTDRQREVLVYLIEGRSQREVALLLGRTPEAVRRTLSDIRQRLTPGGTAQWPLGQRGPGRNSTGFKNGATDA